MPQENKHRENYRVNKQKNSLIPKTIETRDIKGRGDKDEYKNKKTKTQTMCEVHKV